MRVIHNHKKKILSKQQKHVSVAFPCLLFTGYLASIHTARMPQQKFEWKNGREMAECCKVITIKYDSLPMAISETLVVYYPHLCARSFAHRRRKLLTLPEFGSLHLLLWFLSPYDFCPIVFVCGNFDFSNENFYSIILPSVNWPTQEFCSFVQ